MLVKNVYQCKYATCVYGKMRLAINKLSSANDALQKGSDAMGLEPLDNVEIQNNFDELQPHLYYILDTLENFNQLEEVSIEDLSAEVDQFLFIMDTFVTQFQKASEKDIKALVIIELELAVFSLVKLIVEIFFFINPSIKNNCSE